MLEYWKLNKMNNDSQKLLLNIYSEKKPFVFLFQLHRSLLLRSTLEYVTIDLGKDLEPNIL